MKHFFLSLIVVLGFSSCNDGNIIVTSFNFDTISLNKCGDVGEYVFFKINNSNLETLSFQLRTQDSILTTEDTVVYNIDAATNVVNYRTFKGEIPQSYFCSAIPPTTPEVIEDFASTQGIATLFTRITDTVYSGVGVEEDTSYVYTTSIIFNNLRLTNGNETITKETVDFGHIDQTAD